MEKDLDEIRKLLDQTDKSIVENLAKRQELVREVSDLKIDETTNIRDREREQQLLQRVEELARRAGLDTYFAEELFKDIIKHSVRFQTHSLVDHHNITPENDLVRIAYQGTDGAFSHRAAFRHFDERYDKVHCIGFDTFKQAAQAVENEEVDYAILPVENTTAGSINQTYDILGEGNLHIVAEEVIRVVHCLLAIEQVQRKQIKRIISHPQALAQCSQFLSKLHECKVESYIDTAMAARKVAEDRDLSQTAIAGRYAAELYDLEILETDIANQPQNFTRFVIVSRRPVEVDLQIPSKTSLLMTTSHEEGSLIECLNVLDEHNINMTKLESRPRPNEPWKYQFYLDIEANTTDPDIEKVLDELSAKAASVTVLGCYPAQTGVTAENNEEA